MKPSDETTKFAMHSSSSSQSSATAEEEEEKTPWNKETVSRIQNCRRTDAKKNGSDDREAGIISDFFILTPVQKAYTPTHNELSLYNMSCLVYLELRQIKKKKGQSVKSILSQALK